MKLTALIGKLTVALAESGDVNVFLGDMETVVVEDIQVCDTLTDNPEERERYGERYLFIGER